MEAAAMPAAMPAAAAMPAGVPATLLAPVPAAAAAVTMPAAGHDSALGGSEPPAAIGGSGSDQGAAAEHALVFQFHAAQAERALSRYTELAAQLDPETREQHLQRLRDLQQQQQQQQQHGQPAETGAVAAVGLPPVAQAVGEYPVIKTETLPQSDGLPQ
jgi:hypothetical protein